MIFFLAVFSLSVIFVNLLLLLMYFLVIRKELDATKLKYSEASEKLMDKGRQYQKLQTLYDSLRR